MLTVANENMSCHTVPLDKKFKFLPVTHDSVHMCMYPCATYCTLSFFTRQNFHEFHAFCENIFMKYVTITKLSEQRFELVKREYHFLYLS